MSVTTVPETSIRDGARIEVTTGDLIGERGYVVTSEFFSLCANRPDKPRVYYVEIDGDTTCVPFLRSQIATLDELPEVAA